MTPGVGGPRTPPHPAAPQCCHQACRYLPRAPRRPTGCLGGCIQTVGAAGPPAWPGHALKAGTVKSATERWRPATTHPGPAGSLANPRHRRLAQACSAPRGVSRGLTSLGLPSRECAVCSPYFPGHGPRAQRHSGAARSPGRQALSYQHPVRQRSWGFLPSSQPTCWCAPQRRSPCGPCLASVPVVTCAAVRPSWPPAPSALLALGGCRGRTPGARVPSL